MQNDRSPEAGLGQRIIQTFTAPSALAANLRQSAPWIDVLLISLAIALISVWAMPDEVFTAPMEQSVNRRGEPVEVTSSPETIALWGRGMAMLGVIATHPIIAATVAGLLTLVFTLLMRSKVGFREFLSLVSHAMLIPALGTLIAIAVRLITGVGSDSPGMGAYLAPGDASSLLMAAFIAIDPFLIWMLIVVAIGAHVIDPELPTVRTASIILVGYLIFVMATTALAHPELRGASPSPRTAEGPSPAFAAAVQAD